MNTRPRSSHAQRRGAPAAAGCDDELDALIERDPFAALCQLVSEAGGTMRFHGVPISAQQLRGVAGRHAKERLLAAVALLAPEPHVEEHW